MKHSVLNRSSLLLATFLFTVASACAQAATVESSMANPLLTNLRPWCLGHFVIDRPARSEISSERYAYDGYTIETLANVSGSEFEKRASAREQELRSKLRVDPGKRNAATKLPWLEQAISPDQNSRMLIFRPHELTVTQLPFDVEGYVHAGSNMFVLKTSIGSDYVKQAISRDSVLYKDFKYRDNWSVPTERGFCFDGGLITGAPRASEDVVQSFALQPGKPALLNIVIREAVDTDSKTSLKDSLPDLRRQLAGAGFGDRVTVLREGKRRVAGIDAEEVLFSFEDGDLHLYRFYLLAPGNASNVAQPHISMEMALGAPSDSSKASPEDSSPLDRATAIQVWDKMLDSFRLRPGAL